MQTSGDISMKFKYCIMILLLACFICGSAYASDINDTDVSSQDTDQTINVEGLPVETEDCDVDSVVLQNSTDVLSDEGDGGLGERIIWFDSSSHGDGDGSAENPYSVFKEKNIADNSILYFAKGEYFFTFSDDYDRDVVVFNNVRIVGEDSENTVIDFYNTQITTLSLKGNSSVSHIKLNTFCFDGDELEFYDVVVNASKASGTSYFYYSKFIGGKGLYYNDYGGAIYSSDNETSIGIYHCSFINNTEELGGAISMNGGLLVINNCSFVNNKAGYGGVIYMSNNGALYIDNCSFINNTANFYGGAVVCENIYYLEITDTNFEDNTAMNNAGGALYIANSYYGRLENINITNSRALMGGAVTCLNSNIRISGSNFRKNNCIYYGGALYSRLGTIKITDCAFINNMALNGGGLFVVDADDCNVESRFTNNSALVGGAIYSFKSYTQFDNEYFENSALEGGDEYNRDTFNLTFYNGGDYQVFKYNPSEYTTLPEYYNLCDYGWVSPVKDQINNGNCWAFTAFAVLESSILKASNNTVLYDFSEENMKNLMALFSDYGLDVETNQGGSMDMAVGYLVDWLGPVMEKDDLYGFNTLISPLLKSIFQVQNVVFLKRADFTDNDMIKDAILKYGAVGSNMFYDDYYLNNENYAYYCFDDYLQGNHAITIVGWNDTYSKDNFIGDVPGNGAWIVKNSWSPDWGADGYFYVSYYDRMFAPIGKDESAYAILLNDTIRYDKIYQYDICKRGFSGYVETETLTFYNIFKIESDEYLAAVSTYFDDKYGYRVEIYVNDNLKATREGFVNAGYYTIPLNDYVALTKGDKLKVSFTITNLNGDIAGYAFASNSAQCRNNIIEPGNSMVVINNGVDLSDSNCVACIKAFTLKALPVTLNLSDMEFLYNESGSITVDTEASGVIAEIISHPEASVIVNGKTITVSGLDVGSYTLSVTTNDTGYKIITSTANVAVNKCDSVLEVPDSFNFSFDDSYTLSVDYTGAVNVTASVLGNAGSVTVGNKAVTVSGLPRIGDYSLNITTVADDNHNSVSKTVRFTVSKSDSVLNDIDSFEFVYGESYTLNVDYAGAVNVTASVLGNTGKVVVGNKTVTVSGMAAGKHTLNVTAVADSNHNSVSKTVNFTVTKRETPLVILNSNQIPVSSVTYGFGQCSPKLGVYTSEVTVMDDNSPVPPYQRFVNYKILFDGSADNVILSDNGYFYVKNLTVGTYDLYVEITDDNRKGNATFKITVEKGTASLEIPAVTIAYGESGSSTAVTVGSGVTLLSREYADYILIDTKTVTVLPGLDAGVHTISFAVDDTNWQSDSSQLVVNVTKADSTLKDMDFFEFAYGDSYNLEVDYTGAVNVTACVIGHEAGVSVGNNVISVFGLPAGNYTLNVTTVADANHNSIFKTVDFTVNKRETPLVILDNNQNPISSVSYGQDRCSPQLGVYTSDLVLHDDVHGGYLKFTDYDISFDGLSENVIRNNDGSFYLKNLTAATYTLHVEINDVNRRGSGNFNIIINRGIASLEIPEITVTYGKSGSSTADTVASSIKLDSAEYSNYINIEGKLITVSPGLDVGVHKIRFTVDDTNWQSAAPSEFTVNVVKADSVLDDIEPFEFNYTASGTVKVTCINATGVSAYVDGHDEASVNVRNNTITVSNLNAGSYILNVSTITDNNHKSVSKTVGFTVNRINPDLHVTVTCNNTELEIKSNYDGSYSSNVTSDFTIVNGVANVPIYLNPGDYIANIQFKGNTNYNPMSQLAGFKVKSDISPDIDIPEITPGKSSSFPIIVGKGASGTVSLIVDGKIVTVNPLVDGSAAIDIPQLTAGEHTISIQYSGDSSYNSFSYTRQVTVTSHAKITASDMTSFYLDGSAFSVRIFGDDGNPLAGSGVTFRVAGKSFGAVTDSAGYARFTPDQVPGTYSVSCEAGGLSLTRKLTVKPVISAKATTTVKKSKKVTKIKITLKDQSAYKNKPLTVKFNSKKYNIKTNAKGVAVFKVTKKMVKKFRKGKKVKYTITYVKSSLVRYVKIK